MTGPGAGAVLHRGKQKLLGISKRWNKYLRRLFVHGAHAVLQQRVKQSSGLSEWLGQLTSRAYRNVAVVALANKLSRMAWAVLAKGERYRPPFLAEVGFRMTRLACISRLAQAPGLEIADAIPTSADQRLRLTDLNSLTRQVCWRTRRWQNGRTRRSRNL